jgi:hypothetical protein
MKYSEKAHTSTKTVNLAGGEAYQESPKTELTSIALTSFLKDQFYRSADDTTQRVIQLMNTITDKEFIAKLAIFARQRYGMRSISHLMASELADQVKGEEWTKDFIFNVVKRPDDIIEILACFKAMHKDQPIPNCMKKGLANAFSKFDEYAIAKYRGEGHDFKLIDIVNLVHPKSTSKNKKALEALVQNKLRSFDTWEVELSKAGKTDSEESKQEMKKEAWKTLLLEHKIGYFALLRNIRNIMTQAPELKKELILQLTDKISIHKSLVLPFRYLSAMTAIESSGINDVQIIQAINKAAEISLENVPKLPGKSVVVIDKSGSMGRGYESPLGKAAMFGAVLYKALDADLMMFANTAKYKTLNPDDTLMTLVSAIMNDPFGGGTDFKPIFKHLNRKYDRIIILSDMQGWIGYNSPVAEFNGYKASFDTKPYIYSWDLQGYGTLQFPEKNVCLLAGFSDKIFDTMRYVEEDKKALVHEIEQISLKREI